MTNRDLIRKMKMKKNLIGGLVASILGLAFVISGCDSTRHESTKGVVEPADASVGDIVVFGDIRWYVIDKTEAGYTLLSEKPVIKQCFRKAGYGISTSTWEESTVRAWLNDKFYNTFSEEEKALIAKTHNINADNSEYGTSGGNDTDDYIYLLSVDEANALDNSMRRCGTWDSPFHQWWWLRSPGANTSYVTYVGKGKDGVIDPNGDIASNEYGAVRPALNLRLADHTVPTSINRTSVEVETELQAIADSGIDDVVTFQPGSG